MCYPAGSALIYSCQSSWRVTPTRPNSRTKPGSRTCKSGKRGSTPCLLRKNKLILHVKNVMDKKLTLSLDEGVIEDAKLYAEKNKISLSKLIEAYLKAIVDNKTKNVKVTPLVKSISGVVKLPPDFDLRDEYTKYLIEKYR